MWKSKLRKEYGSFEEFEHWERAYGLAKRLGFENATEAWDANPMIQGSTDPVDFKTVAQARREARAERLMPNGVPRYVRCFDSKTFGDRYTVIFTKKMLGMKDGSRSGVFIGLGMSGAPFHPQGIGQHFETDNPRGHAGLGKRIRFDQLPPDCQALVLSDYREIWEC